MTFFISILNREREQFHKQRATENSLIPKHHTTTQKKPNKDLQLKLKKLEAKVHLLNLQVRRHYSLIICDPLCENPAKVIFCFLQKNHPSNAKEHSVKM